jgi:hypothetical protein
MPLTEGGLDGILGMDILNRFDRVEINIETRTITLEEQ